MRPKVYRLTSAASKPMDTSLVMTAHEASPPPTMEAQLAEAMFTGKGDHEVVLQAYYGLLGRYRRLLQRESPHPQS